MLIIMLECKLQGVFEQICLTFLCLCWCLFFSFYTTIVDIELLPTLCKLHKCNFCWVKELRKLTCLQFVFWNEWCLMQWVVNKTSSEYLMSILLFQDFSLQMIKWQEYVFKLFECSIGLFRIGLFYILCYYITVKITVILQIFFCFFKYGKKN